MKKIFDYATSKKPYTIDFSLLKTEIIDDKLFVKYDGNSILSDVLIPFEDSHELDWALINAFSSAIDNILEMVELKPRALKLISNFSRNADETEEPKLMCTLSKSESRTTSHGIYILLRVAKQSYYEKWGWVNHDIDIDLKKHYNIFKTDIDLFKLCVIIEASNWARRRGNLEELETCVSAKAKELMRAEAIRISNQYK